MTKTSTRALLVVDAQESFRQRPDDWSKTANPQVFDQINKLVEHARTSGDSLVWITHTEPGSGGVFDPQLGFTHVVEDLSPRAQEIQIVKTSINAFTSTDLLQQLQHRGIETLVICGIRTEQCCETTARIAADLGFEVVFVLDATTTSALPEGNGTVALSGEEIMQRTASVLAGRKFARVLTTREYIGAPTL